MSQTLILISCSNRKNRGGKKEYQFKDSILSAINDKTTLINIYRTRSDILNLLINGEVEDRLRGRENRRGSPYNNNLKIGPDFSPDFLLNNNSDIFYMPAYERYDGRFFTHAGGVETFLNAVIRECHTLITSGLYGLITLEEPIQAYNCHLDDELINPKDDKNEYRVSDLWRNRRLFNDILQSFIIDHDKKYPNNKIKVIIDLLSETSYQNIFVWEELWPWLRERKIGRLHRYIPTVKEPDFLSDLGKYYKEMVENCNVTPSLNTKVSRDYFTDISQNNGYLMFKAEVVPDPFTENQLEKRLSHNIWKTLDKKTRNELVQGEIWFQVYDASSDKNPDEPVPKVLNLWTAVEIELDSIFHKAIEKYSLNDYRENLCAKKTLHAGNLEESELKEINDELKKLIGYRQAHTKIIIRKHLLNARDIVLKNMGLLSKLVKLKKYRI